jgi:integrase
MAHHNTRYVQQAGQRLPHGLAEPLPAASARLALSRSGKWEIRYTSRDDATGTYRSRTQATGAKNEVEAQARLREFQDAMRQELGPNEAPPSPCLQPLIERYLDALEAQHPLRRLGQEDALTWPRRLLGDTKPGDITQAVMDRYLETRRRGRAGGIKDSSLRRELSALQAALRWGVKKGHLQASDLHPFDLPSAGAPRDIWMDEATEARVHQAALDLYMQGPRSHPNDNERRDMGLFLLIALNTAARKQAIMSLRWDRVDMTARRIDFRDPARPVTKKRRVMVPISDRLWPVLELAHREANGEGKVFKHHSHAPDHLVGAVNHHKAGGRP